MTQSRYPLSSALVVTLAAAGKALINTVSDISPVLQFLKRGLYRDTRCVSATCSSTCPDPTHVSETGVREREGTRPRFRQHGLHALRHTRARCKYACTYKPRTVYGHRTPLPPPPQRFVLHACFEADGEGLEGAEGAPPPFTHSMPSQFWASKFAFVRDRY